MAAGILVGVYSPVLAVGPAFTGLVAKADSAETVYVNPAGMTRLRQQAWYASSQVIYTENSTEFTVQGQSGTQKIKTDGFVFLPGLYYVKPLNERWAIGIGPNAASGLGASYGDQWAGRYILNEWSEVFIGVVPSVAYRVNSKISIGFSLSLNYSLFSLEKSVFNGVGLADGNFELKADGFGMGGNLGLMYELSPQTRVGIVYRSSVEAEDEGIPELSGLSAARKTLLENAGVLDQKISMDVNTPQSLMIGLFHNFGNGWTISADTLWLDFSEWNIENITIGNTQITQDSSEYQDIWAFSLGTTRDLNPEWSLRGGILYVSSGVEDEDRTLFTRLDAMWAIGAGVEHTFKSKRKLAVDVTYLQFGDGEFTTPSEPGVNTINGIYDTNYGISLGVSFTF